MFKFKTSQLGKTHKRQLRIEPLEQRQMLSVSPWEANMGNPTENSSTACEAPAALSVFDATAASFGAAMESTAPDITSLTAGTDFITVSWTNNFGEDATHSRVYLRSAEDNTILQNKAVSSPDGTVTFTGLASDTDYTVEVSTSYSPNDWKTVFRSDWAVEPTKTLAPVPVTSTAPDITSLTAGKDSITVSWTNNFMGATNTRVYLCSADGVILQNKAASTPEGTMTFTGLQPGTEYTIQVSTSYSLNDWKTIFRSDWAEQSITTKTSTAPGVELTAGKDSITVSWTNNFEDATDTRVYLCSADGVILQSKAVSSPNGTMTITGLMPGKEYTVRVSTSYSPNGTWGSGDVFRSEWAVESTTTKTSAAPDNLQVVNKGTDFVELSWTNNLEDATDARVRWSDDNGATWTSAAFKTAEAGGTATITGLDPNTEYQFQVRTSYTWGSWKSNDSVYSDYSISLTETTEAEEVILPEITGYAVFSTDMSIVQVENEPTNYTATGDQQIGPGNNVVDNATFTVDKVEDVTFTFAVVEYGSYGNKTELTGTCVVDGFNVTINYPMTFTEDGEQFEYQLYANGDYIGSGLVTFVSTYVEAPAPVLTGVSFESDGDTLKFVTVNEGDGNFTVTATGEATATGASGPYTRITSAEFAFEKEDGVVYTYECFVETATGATMTLTGVLNDLTEWKTSGNVTVRDGHAVTYTVYADGVDMGTVFVTCKITEKGQMDVITGRTDPNGTTYFQLVGFDPADDATYIASKNGISFPLMNPFEGLSELGLDYLASDDFGFKIYLGSEYGSDVGSASVNPLTIGPGSYKIEKIVAGSMEAFWQFEMV